MDIFDDCEHFRPLTLSHWTSLMTVSTYVPWHFPIGHLWRRGVPWIHRYLAGPVGVQDWWWGDKLDPWHRLTHQWYHQGTLTGSEKSQWNLLVICSTKLEILQYNAKGVEFNPKHTAVMSPVQARWNTLSTAKVANKTGKKISENKNKKTFSVMFS